MFRANLKDRGSSRLTDAEIKIMLRDNIDTDKQNVGLAVGIIDEHGSRVISHGHLDNGTDRDVDGDTLFEIGSITKVFTALLLQDMIERGEMKLDDPVQKYLPNSVKRFPGPRDLAGRMVGAGMTDVRWILTAGGIIAIHAGTVA